MCNGRINVHGLSGRLRETESERGERWRERECVREAKRKKKDERQPGEKLEVVLGDGKRTRGLNTERRKQREEEIVVIENLNLKCSNKRNANWEIGGYKTTKVEAG